MRDLRSYDFIVLGGGLAGLTFALEMSRRGSSVVLLEIDSKVGGLARTLVFKDYRFDIGGHRFHTSQPRLLKWVTELMDGDLLEVSRQSRIYLGGRYVDYPLQFPNALGAFSPPKSAQLLGSYLKAAAQRNGHLTEISFEDWVTRRFGWALYNIYFRPYTEKVWGIPCTELSADWASQRIKLPSLASAVKTSLFPGKTPPATLISRFQYPPLGFGAIPERIAALTTATGRASILLSAKPSRLVHDSETGAWQVNFTKDGKGEAISGRQVVSTIPLGALLRLLPPTADRAPGLGDTLGYRSVMCVLLAIDGPRVSADTWTYFPDKELILGRTHEPPNWSPKMAPPGKTSLCAEIFCFEGDDVWRRSDAELIGSVQTDLARLGILARERVSEGWVARVPDAYPVYRVGYDAQLRRVRDYLASWSTLHLLGRTGSFEYLNADAVIAQALDTVDMFAGVA
jgi:protoporphyrinogen oxidase